MSIFLKVYLVLAVLGLRCCRGFSLVAVLGFLILLLWSAGSRACGFLQLRHTGSVAVAPGL